MSFQILTDLFGWPTEEVNAAILVQAMLFVGICIGPLLFAFAWLGGSGRKDRDADQRRRRR